MANEDLSSRITQIQTDFEIANEEFSEYLQMFAERIILYRITRVNDKRLELDFLAKALKEAHMQSDDPSTTPKEIPLLGSLIKETENMEVSRAFSKIVDGTESLSAKQLYYFISKLRGNGPR